jgi:hypothetical protein
MDARTAFYIGMTIDRRSNPKFSPGFAGAGYLTVDAESEGKFAVRSA